jgi:polyhydroxybutyrate depolymerase
MQTERARVRIRKTNLPPPLLVVAVLTRLCVFCWLTKVLPQDAVATELLAPGNHSIEMQYEGRARSYLVHVPNAAAGSARPVVLNFHGGGGNAATHQQYVQMDALADHENFLVVYPNGTGVLSAKLLTWNAGPCCGYAKDRNVDDVGFTRALVQDLARRMPIDRDRVYATGLSNGAMMAYRIARDAPDLVAAIAPVAGASLLEPSANREAMPIMHIHSVDDPRALYAGGFGPPFPLTNRRVKHPAVEASLMQWVDANGCTREPRIGATAYGGPSKAHSATPMTFAACRDGVEVILWQLTGSGHVWPGGKAGYLTHWLGESTDVIDANAEMWRFFHRFTRAH